MFFRTRVKLDQIPRKNSFCTFRSLVADSDWNRIEHYPKFWISPNIDLPKDFDLNATYEITCSVTYAKNILNGEDKGRTFLYLKEIKKAEKESRFIEGCGYLRARFKSYETWTITTDKDNSHFKVSRLCVEDDYTHTYLWVYGDTDFSDLKKGVAYRFTCALFNKRNLINGYISKEPQDNYNGKPIWYTELQARTWITVKEADEKRKKFKN